MVRLRSPVRFRLEAPNKKDMCELKNYVIYKHFKGDYYLIEDVTIVPKQRKNI